MDLDEELKLLREQQAKDRQGKPQKEGEGEDDQEGDELYFDFATMSIVEEVQEKNQKLTKELQDREARLHLLQNECDSLLNISK